MAPQTGAHTFLKWLCPDRRSHHVSGTFEAGGSSILASTSCLSVAIAMRIFSLNHDVRTKQRERTARAKLLSGTASTGDGDPSYRLARFSARLWSSVSC